MGITIEKGKFGTTGFLSFRKLDGNLVRDSLTNEDHISSFISSGYHRTAGENTDRNNLTQLAFGLNTTYKERRWQIGVNSIFYKFSLPLMKANEPYNLYAISGKSWNNMSLDYSYTYRNVHFFGEFAVDKNLKSAFINGLLLSVDPAVDLSFVQRTISKSFQSINGNAFTENVYPVNETGFYIGLAMRPGSGWRFDMYGDIYRFPWLKFRIDAPSCGKDFLVQLTYTPNRQVELYSRYRNETKQQAENQAGNSVIDPLVIIPRQSWRTQVNFQVNRDFTLRHRIEMLWYNNKVENRETGFLGFFDVLYRPLLSACSGVLRLQYFETDGFDSRIYAYENDVSYSYSIPAFSDKGLRYCLTINYELSKKLSFWIILAQTIYVKGTAGSGPDQVESNHRTELKIQARVLL
jgi:hypothetical protein